MLQFEHEFLTGVRVLDHWRLIHLFSEKWGKIHVYQGRIQNSPLGGGANPPGGANILHFEFLTGVRVLDHWL